MNHITKARRMKKLFLQIRKALKKLNLSCSTSFSSFQLSMDSIISIKQLTEITSKSSSSILRSFHNIQKYHFILYIITLSKLYIRAMAYDPRSRIRRIQKCKQNKLNHSRSTRESAIDFIDFKIFFQWLCMNRFETVLNVQYDKY